MSSRTENTKRNIIASYAVMAIQIIFHFVLRTAVVYTLGVQYLGLSSLFTSILGVLNIAELGFTTSIIYFMYKPLADGNTEKVCALLAYLKKVYVYVGSVILVVGIVIAPFIQLLIKGDIPADINVYLLYAMHLINAVVGYLLYAHKMALLTAMQRLDVTKIAGGFVSLGQYVIQLIVLIQFHSYYLYIIAMILGTIVTNILVGIICHRKFPEYECRGTVEEVEKKEIFSKVKAMMICNVCNVTYTTVDSIIISLLSGLVLVAVYGNYIVIFSTLTSFIMVIRSAMQASVGNSVALESLEKNYNDVMTWQFGFSFICAICMSCMICLYQPFMRIWMGNMNLLPMTDVILISVWFMVSNVQNAFYLYLMGSGLFEEMKWVYVISTCFNLVMNLVLGKLMGVTGIILASLLSSVIFGTFWQCIIIFKHYFKMSARGFIYKQFLYFLAAALISGVAYLACSVVQCGGWSELLLKGAISAVVTLSLLVVIFYKSQYFTKTKEFALRVVYRRLGGQH